MADKTLFGDDLENLLLTWQKKYGTEQTNKQGNIYYKITDMRTALNALANTFISIGYTHEDLKSSLLSSQIQRSVTPHKYDGKLAEWRLIIDKQWKNVLNDFFPDTRLQEATEPKSIDKPTVFLEKQEEEMAPGLRRNKDGLIVKDYEIIDPKAIKGVVMPEYTIVDNDPLAFLKKSKDE